LKLKEDLYKNDKLDDQHIIENNIQSINKLREELSNAKNALAETEQKVYYYCCFNYNYLILYIKNDFNLI